jgi:uncharacterized membrane protein YbhN (UPF0104 family)
MSGSDAIEYQSLPPRRRRMIWMRLVAWAICAIVLYFVIRALVRQFHAVEWSQVDLKIFPALAAIVCVFGVSLMQLLARWTLLIAYGYPLNWRVQLPVAWVPQLGKYVPGGIASVGGAVYLLRKHGVPGAIGLSVAVLLDALAVMAGLIVSTPLLLWRPVRERMPLAWLACAGMVIVGIVMLHPRVFVGLLNRSLRLIKRQPIAQTPPLAKYLWPVLASFGQWLFAGFGLWFMTMAVTPVQASLIPLFIASAALAMTVSYLMPFTPGGLGIREGLYLITLGPTIGPRVAIVVVAMRVIQTVIEIVLAGIGAWVMRTAPTTIAHAELSS